MSGSLTSLTTWSYSTERWWDILERLRANLVSAVVHLGQHEATQLSSSVTPETTQSHPTEQQWDTWDDEKPSK